MLGLTINPSKCELVFYDDPEPQFKSYITERLQTVCPSLQLTKKLLKVTLKKSLALIAIPSVLGPPGLMRSDGKCPNGLTTVSWVRSQSLIWDVTIADFLRLFS